jgi:hypothetical protein
LFLGIADFLIVRYFCGVFGYVDIIDGVLGWNGVCGGVLG